MLRPLHITSFVCALLLPLTIGVELVFPPPVFAQNPGGKGKGPQLQARALFKESQDLQRAGDLRGALAKLEEAYDILPTPTLLWPIAELRLGLRQPLQGLEALSRYRREMAPADMEPGQQLADADKLEEKLRAQLGYLRPAVAPGATITVDGRELGRAPLPEKISVNPGTHRVSASGGTLSRPVDATVEVQPGQEVEVPLNEETKVGPKAYWPHPLTWAAIGLSTASLFASTVLGGITITETRNLDASCPDRLCLGGTSQDITLLNQQVSTQRTHGIAAGTLLGFTTAFLVGTTALILFDWQRQKAGGTLLKPPQKSASSSLLHPVINLARDGAEFALGVRF